MLHRWREARGVTVDVPDPAGQREPTADGVTSLALPRARPAAPRSGRLQHPRRASTGWSAVVLAAAYVLLLVGLIWLMLGPPAGFAGFARDTATAEAPRRLALYAEPWGRSPVPWSGTTYAWAVRGVLVALFAVHGLAVLVVRRSGGRDFRMVWYGLPVAALVVALAYPPTSADVFYYAVAGEIADRGANPYQVPPAAFPDSPLVPLNYWTGITSPYGPLWTTVARGVVGVVGSDPLRVSIVFKGLAGLAALACAGLAGQLAERIRAGTGPAAFVLVAWHPLLVLETAGTGHVEAAVAATALFGLLLAAGRRTRAAVLAVATSALIKPTTLPLLAAVALSRLRAGSARRLLADWVVDGLGVALLAAVLAAPYWADGALARSILAERGRLLSNPFYALPAEAVANGWGAGAGADFREIARIASAIVAAGAVLAALALLAVRTWSDRYDRRGLLRHQLQAWAAITLALSLLPTNAHPWYAASALAAVAALSGGRGRVLVPFLIVLALFSIAYHTEVSGP